MRTIKEFNTRYKDLLLLEDSRGLVIDEPSIVHFLNEIFKDFEKIPGFKYDEIYVYGGTKFMSNLEDILPFAGRVLKQEIEEKINLLLKVEFEIERRLASINLDKYGKPLQSL